MGHKIGDMIFTERSLSSDRVYEYSQESLRLKLKTAWGKHSEQSGVTQNDIARAYGILCDPDFEVERCSILKLQGTERAVVDDPARNILNCCVRLMQTFNDPFYEVSHPPNWLDASGI